MYRHEIDQQLIVNTLKNEMDNKNREQELIIYNLKCELNLVNKEIQELKQAKNYENQIKIIKEKDNLNQIRKAKEDINDWNDVINGLKEDIIEMTNEKDKKDKLFDIINKEIKQIKENNRLKDKDIINLHKDKSKIIDENNKIKKENENLKVNNARKIIEIAEHNNSESNVIKSKDNKKCGVYCLCLKCQKESETKMDWVMKNIQD